MIPTLETQRLTLRAPTLADAAIYAEFYAGATGPGNYGGPRRADEAFHVLCRDVGHWSLLGFGKWMLDLKHGTTIGGCGLVHPLGWPSHELTWWLMPSHRGHGYAIEASRAAISFGYDTLGWSSVETHMRDDNAAARRLAERLGGQKTRRELFPDGVTRDVFTLPRSTATGAAA
jgi:RimJ/RimL family protein N-acetyltransferase